MCICRFGRPHHQVLSVAPPHAPILLAIAVADCEEPLMDALVQCLNEALESSIASEEAELVQGSCKGSGMVPLIVAVACEKHEGAGGPHHLVCKSIATGSRMRKAAAGVASHVQQRHTRFYRVGCSFSPWSK